MADNASNLLKTDGQDSDVLALIDIEAVDRERKRRRRRKMYRYFPAEGPNSRDKYPKCMEFFAAGAKYRERLFMAANRVGKSQAAADELAFHLTGDYPDWWQGRRFDKPIRAWAVSTTSIKTRDVNQLELLGTPGSADDMGTGFIPGESIIKTTPKAGIPNGIEYCYVRHKSGGTSYVQFKSYDQGRTSFQGDAIDVIWPDEECPEDIYTEILLRTMTTGGIVMLTYTPINGLTPLTLNFMENAVNSKDRKESESADSSKYLITATWDDAPHLTEEAKKALWDSIPPYQRDARAKGIPFLGSGAIYPVSEDLVRVEPFKIPEHWPKAYGLDVGWNFTAAVWGAWDRESDTVYLYSAFKQSHAEPYVHASSVHGRGKWVPGVIDPASRGRGQKDGVQLLQVYKDLGLNIDTAQNGVEAGIYEVWQRMVSGRLKVFSSLGDFWEEFRLYRRDEKGRVVKERDHVMDAMRYLIVSGLEKAKCGKDVQAEVMQSRYLDMSHSQRGWMM